jgi:hypothetical protein
MPNQSYQSSKKTLLRQLLPEGQGSKKSAFILINLRHLRAKKNQKNQRS